MCKFCWNCEKDRGKCETRGPRGSQRVANIGKMGSGCAAGTNNSPSRGHGKTPPYMWGEPLRPRPQNSGSPRDAKRRHETPRDATRRRDEMPRDAMRRHKTPRDASETPRDSILMPNFVIFSNFKLILASPEHHFSMLFWDTNFASFFGQFFGNFPKNQKRKKYSKHCACAWF